MLQFYVELCCIESNVAHKVQRYINLFVASELVSDVEGFIPERTHVASTNNKLYSGDRMIDRLAASPGGPWGRSLAQRGD